MKDTCCNAEMIAARVAQLKGSCFKLLNAVRQELRAADEAGKRSGRKAAAVTYFS